jgi:hypothetical protein
LTQHPVAGVDHVFLLVHDLDARRAAFERMGFTVSPRGLHSAAKGSANHTIMFPHDYVELLGIVAETPGNAGRRAVLRDAGEGLHAVACRIDDAAAAGAALAAHGVATEGYSEFARPVPLPGGGEAEAAFATLQFVADETPVGLCFMCEHRTRKTVWLPELLEHANTATALHAVVAAVADPADAARRFARLFRDGAVAPIQGGAAVRTGERSATITLLTPDAFAAEFSWCPLADTPTGAYAALQIAVRDLGAAQSALEASGLEWRRTERGVAVAPRDAGGAGVEFVSAG